MSLIIIRLVSLAMESSSAAKIEDVTAEIERRASATCAVDGITGRSYYEAAFTQCFFVRY